MKILQVQETKHNTKRVLVDMTDEEYEEFVKHIRLNERKKADENLRKFYYSPFKRG